MDCTGWTVTDRWEAQTLKASSQAVSGEQQPGGGLWGAVCVHMGTTKTTVPEWSGSC